jgi:LacI family transcriptional regulator
MTGRFETKDRTATIRDVAAAAGVSTATVSRVLAPGGAGGVSEKARLRVRKAAETLQYRANHAARSLKTRLTRTVAIVAPELGNTFFMDLAEGMERELDAHDYTLLVASSANSVEEEKKRITMLGERMVDGMMVIPAGSRGDHLGIQDRYGVPVVLIDRLVEGANLDAVLSDNEAGAFELTRRLLADGFRRIAFMGGDITISAARERFSGFTRALGEAGIRVEPDWLRLGGMGIEDGYRRMETLLASPHPPEALIAVNLLVHLGIQRRLLEDGKNRGFRAGPRGKAGIPPVVIAAFDETVYTPFLPACRYTAAQDAAGMGKEAALRLLERINLRRKAAKVPDAPPETPEKRVIRFPVTILGQ